MTDTMIHAYMNAMKKASATAQQFSGRQLRNPSPMRLPQNLVDDLDAEVAHRANGITRAQLVREILADGLVRLRKKWSDR